MDQASAEEFVPDSCSDSCDNDDDVENEEDDEDDDEEDEDEEEEEEEDDEDDEDDEEDVHSGSAIGGKFLLDADDDINQKQMSKAARIEALLEAAGKLEKFIFDFTPTFTRRIASSSLEFFQQVTSNQKKCQF